MWGFESVDLGSSLSALIGDIRVVSRMTPKTPADKGSRNDASIVKMSRRIRKPDKNVGVKRGFS